MRLDKIRVMRLDGMRSDQVEDIRIRGMGERNRVRTDEIRLDENRQA